MNWIHMAHRN